MFTITAKDRDGNNVSLTPDGTRFTVATAHEAVQIVRTVRCGTVLTDDFERVPAQIAEFTLIHHNGGQVEVFTV